MSKSLPVYELGQWINNGGTYGYIVARRSCANVFEVRQEYEYSRLVQDMSRRGAGYCVEWVALKFPSPKDPTISHIFDEPIGFTATRLRWLRVDTLADARYMPCDSPIATPTEPAQQPLALDIEAATEATMRAMVAVGKRAEDWLRAKGLSV